MISLPILYRDEWLVAVDKPPGIHVHPTAFSPNEDSCVRMLRDQLGQWVFTIHRLDRATSGVLLFALNSDVATAISAQFAGREVKKRYLAIVRGYLPEGEQRIDRPLREEPHLPPDEAITVYRRLATGEIPVPTGKFPTSRFSLAEVLPQTGRKNQIRRHLAGISHPIIGDVQFGDGRQNRIFRENLDSRQLLLLAMNLEITHPFSAKILQISAPLPQEFRKIFAAFGWPETVVPRW